MSTQRPLWDNDGGARGRRLDSSVHWVCRKPSHLSAPARAGRGGLFVHEGRWAYCDGDTPDRDHEWAPTGGVSIDRLIDWARALDPWRAHTVKP